MSVRADVETIRSIPIFSGCDPAHLQLLAFSAVRQSFERGQTLFVQDEPGTAAYLILNGRVHVSAKGTGPLREAGPGALLGEVAMIGGGPYSITARALDTVSTARIDRSLFLRVTQEFPEFAAAVFRALARKLDLSMQDLGEIGDLFQKARSFNNL